MLCDRLSAQTEVTFHGQTIPQFEQCLAVTLDQFIENGALRWSSQCLDDINPKRNDRQVWGDDASIKSNAMSTCCPDQEIFLGKGCRESQKGTD